MLNKFIKQKYMFKIPKVNFGLLDKYYEKKTNKNFKQQIDNIMSTK